MNNHGPTVDDNTNSDTDTDSVDGSEIHEIPAGSDTELDDTELEDPAPMAHGSDSVGASVAETELAESAHAAHGSNDDGGNDTAAMATTPKPRRRRRNSSRFFSNGNLFVTPTRAQAKRTRKLNDHLSPPRSCRLAMRRLEDHNDLR